MAGRTCLYGIAATGFVVFAVWGTLFPFDFHRGPLTTAAALLLRTWRTPPAMWSLTDTLSNVLLFVPIGLFVMASVETAGWARGGKAALGVVGAIVLLSGSIEFGQAFLSWRQPSVLDVIAEACGALIGLAIWRGARAEIDRLSDMAIDLVRRSTTIERLLLLYCAGFVVVWLLPLDFTLRPAEIGDKYHHQRLLLPFTPSPDAASPWELVFTLAAAVPLGIAAALSGCQTGMRRSLVRALLVAGPFLVVLECAQVLVFSRTTDATALLAAVAGTMPGAVLARMTKRPEILTVDYGTLRAAALVAAWFVVAAICEWWPFDLVLDPNRAREQTTAWSLSPFRSPAAVRDVLPGAILGLAAGVFVAARLSPRFSRLQMLITVVFGGAVLLAFEAGRGLLPGGRPTLVSVLVKEAMLVLGLVYGVGMQRRNPVRESEYGSA